MMAPDLPAPVRQGGRVRMYSAVRMTDRVTSGRCCRLSAGRLVILLPVILDLACLILCCQ